MSSGCGDAQANHRKNFSVLVYASETGGQLSDWTEVIVSVGRGPEYPLPANAGPKIVQSSCGSISVPENRAILNLLRVFVEGGMCDNGITFRIEGTVSDLNKIF